MKKENTLGTAPIGKLLVHFAVPCVLSMLVSALYNIVDQIFIGWGVGYLGNAATNVVYPFTVLALAVALMIGDGSAALFSLSQGAGGSGDSAPQRWQRHRAGADCLRCADGGGIAAARPAFALVRRDGFVL